MAPLKFWKKNQGVYIYIKDLSNFAQNNYISPPPPPQAKSFKQKEKAH